LGEIIDFRESLLKKQRELNAELAFLHIIDLVRDVKHQSLKEPGTPLYNFCKEIHRIAAHGRLHVDRDVDEASFKTAQDDIESGRAWDQL